MGLDIRFYEATSPVLGGDIDTGNLLGSLISTSEQDASASDFPSMTSEADGGAINNYFKKFFAKNHEAVSILEPTIYLEDLSDPSEVFIARAHAAADATASNRLMPLGYESSEFENIAAYEDRIAAKADSSSMTAAAYQGYWLWFKIGPGQAAETASGTIVLDGRTS